MSIQVMSNVWKHSQSTGRARLVLLAIADHQGEIGAWPSIPTLAKMVNASERSVQRDIQELVELGELQVSVQQAPSRGQYKSNLYWVTVGEFSGVTEIDSGVTDLHSGVTESASGVTAGGVLTITKPLLEPVNLYDDFDSEFDKFWSAYPRKENKQSARRAMKSALKKTSFYEILAGANRYRLDPNRDPAYTKHAATWLNNECWNDDPLPARGSVNVKQQQQAVAAERFLANFEQPKEITSEPDWA